MHPRFKNVIPDNILKMQSSRLPKLLDHITNFVLQCHLLYLLSHLFCEAVLFAGRKAFLLKLELWFSKNWKHCGG